MAEAEVQSLAMKTMGPVAAPGMRSVAGRWLLKKWYENFGSRKMSMQPDDSMSGE